MSGWPPGPRFSERRRAHPPQRRARPGAAGAAPGSRRRRLPLRGRRRGQDAGRALRRARTAARLPHLLVLRPRHRCPERDVAAARPHSEGARHRPRGLAAPARRIRMSERSPMNLPPVVSAEDWQAAREALLAKEKDATRARDALAAERRRLPMVRIEKDYAFAGPDGKAGLVDLFEGRRQLLLYHFMFGPNQDAGCDGCSMFADQVGHLAHLHARDTSFALVSRAPLAKITAYKKRMGWKIPWYSAFERH